MRFAYGDMSARYLKYPANDEIFCITANDTIIKGNLVMGCGAALSFKNTLPQLPKYAAESIKHVVFAPHIPGYYLIPVMPRLMLFQVKHDFREPAQYDLIHQSAVSLYQYASTNEDTLYHVNYPGIGAGGLPIAKVKKILLEAKWGECDNIIVWRLKK